MPIFGYSKRVTNEHGLHEMSEVTFAFSVGDIRRIASFLNHYADLMDSGEMRDNHLHLISHDRNWNKDHPDSDVIAINPAPGSVKITASRSHSAPPRR